MVKEKKEVIKVYDTKNEQARRSRANRLRAKSKNSSKSNAKRTAETYAQDQAVLGNDYLLTLVDPFNYRSVAHIPDRDLHPSSLFSIRKRVESTINAQGVGGSILGYVTTPEGSFGSLVPLHMNSPVQGASTYAYRYPIGTIIPSTGTQFSLLTGATLANSQNEFIWFDNFTYSYATATPTPVGYISYFSHVRLVSLGITVKYQGAPLNAKGEIVMAQAPYGSLSNYASGPGVAEILSLPGAVRYPVNELKGANVTYRPVDNSSLEYTFIDGSPLSYPTGLSAGDNIWSNSYKSARLNEIYVIASGCTVGDLLQIEITANYEAIPLSNQADFIAPQNVKSDTQQLEHAMNVASSTPSVFTGNKITERGGANETYESQNHSLDGVKLAQNTKGLLDARNKHSMPFFQQLLDSKSPVRKTIDDVIGIAKDVGPIVASVIGML